MDACSGIEEIKEERLGNKSIGFNKATSNKPVLSSEGQIYTKEDLIKYGFTPELVGRINGIHVTNPMTIDIFENILKKSKESVLTRYIRGFEIMGISLELYPTFYKEVAEKALGYETGARELENIVKNVFRNLMHDIYDTENPVSRVILKEGITNDNSKYEII